jgi:hypothetical protein
MELQHGGEWGTPHTVFGMRETICKLQNCKAWLQISVQTVYSDFLHEYALNGAAFCN